MADDCEECDSKQLKLQRQSADPAEPSAAPPPIVRKVLRSPGQPFDGPARDIMESRFGHDFSRVRVHADAQAAESAQAVNALAYTVGQHIVFGPGQYAPRTSAGQKLLTHELVHTIQQESGGENISASGMTIGEPGDALEQEANRVADAIASAPARENGGTTSAERPAARQVLQRANASIISRYDFTTYCGSSEECPERETGETVRADRAKLKFGLLPTETNAVIYPFDIDSSNPSTLRSDPEWNTFRRGLADKNERWEILGFSDCKGAEARNTDLRKARADRVFNLLSSDAKAKIDLHEAAPLDECVSPNDSEEGRALNRSAVFHFVSGVIDDKEDVELHSCPPTSDNPVTSIGDYVFLMMCAEKQMGLGPREMLAMFRQLYYGKSWSSASTSSKWDTVIPCSPNVGKPEDKLGTNLFNALRNSKSIDGVAVGHVFTGLEAMTCPSSDVVFSALGGVVQLGVEMSNEAFSTWGGDLGAAVAAYVACPQLGSGANSNSDCGNKTAQDLAFYQSLHAPDQELEGDIDSFVMRAKLLGILCAGSRKKSFSPTQPISEIFHDYYMDQQSALGTAQSNNYECALQAIGATVNNKSITNRPDIRDPLAYRVSSFADAYFMKIKGGGYTDMSDAGDRRKMDSAAYLTVDWFLDWLESRL